MPRKPNRSQHRSNPKIAFGLVLRQLREQSGDSQDSFAHRTGYHRNYVGQLERGEKSPSPQCAIQPSQSRRAAPFSIVGTRRETTRVLIYPGSPLDSAPVMGLSATSGLCKWSSAADQSSRDLLPHTAGPPTFAKAQRHVCNGGPTVSRLFVA